MRPLLLTLLVLLTYFVMVLGLGEFLARSFRVEPSRMYLS